MGEEVKMSFKIDNEEVFRGSLDLDKLSKYGDKDLDIGKCVTGNVRLGNQEIFKMKCCRIGEKKYSWTMEGINEKGEKEREVIIFEK